MSLRLRLLLGYGYLVSLLLLTAGSALLGFLQLGAGIDRVLEDNFRSITAAMRLLEALERQDSATLALLLGDEAERFQEEMRTAETAFTEALAEAQANITEVEEGDVLERLEATYQTYREARQALLAAQPERPLSAYTERVFPAFFELKRDTLRVLEINHQAMILADQEARQTALRSSAWLGFLATVALLSMIFLARAMQQQVLGRLQALRELTAAIAVGDVRRRLSEKGADELAAVARQLNQALDRQTEFGAQMRAQLAGERQLALALIEHFPTPVVVVALDGEILGSNSTASETRLAKPLARWAREEGRELLRPRDAAQEPVAATLSVSGERFRAELLRVAGRRPVAWLVRPVGRRRAVAAS